VNKGKSCVCIDGIGNRNRKKMMNESHKYNRTLHAQISLGTTSDDRIMPNGYVKAFAEMEDGCDFGLM
jgi:hypothetical protein